LVDLFEFIIILYKRNLEKSR